MKDLLLSLFSYFKDMFIEVVSIKDGTDVDGTIDSIKKDVGVRGANVWILVSAAMLASIGLDVSSSAVIIGAMLISPLMAPILGIGLSIGISDRTFLQDSLKNFGIAVFVSLATSFVYFTLTPLGQPTAEMLARTRPTLLDVGVAIFGGVAGIVANSRKYKTNAIPGVAIATALMPPLCTAGYGLASGDGAFFWGAFYLFFINAVFIALSTYAIVRFLNFPLVEFLDVKIKRKMQSWIAIFATIVIVPSAYIFYGVVVEAKREKDTNSFVKNRFNSAKYEAIRTEFIEGDSTTTLKLYAIGEPIPKDTVKQLQKDLAKYGLEDITLNLVQMNVPESEREQIKKEAMVAAATDVMKKISMTKEVYDAKDRQIDSLKKHIQYVSLDSGTVAQLKKESFALYPEIKKISFGMIDDYQDSTGYNPIPVALIELIGNGKSRDKDEIFKRYSEYFKVRMGRQTARVFLK
jgi:uncharacterized hydrophobic protein (TIGR00271 family)